MSPEVRAWPPATEGGERDAEAPPLSGQRKYPVIEFDDGTVYRAESSDMAARIREGKLFSNPG
jgi:hypothetical protein